MTASPIPLPLCPFRREANSAVREQVRSFTPGLETAVKSGL